MIEDGGLNVIACIGWGSPVWRAERLPLRSGWYEGGSLLPVNSLDNRRTSASHSLSALALHEQRALGHS